jgi:hypothetical protein
MSDLLKLSTAAYQRAAEDRPFTRQSRRIIDTIDCCLYHAAEDRRDERTDWAVERAGKRVVAKEVVTAEQERSRGEVRLTGFPKWSSNVAKLTGDAGDAGLEQQHGQGREVIAIGEWKMLPGC